MLYVCMLTKRQRRDHYRRDDSIHLILETPCFVFFCNLPICLFVKYLFLHICQIFVFAYLSNICIFIFVKYWYFYICQMFVFAYLSNICICIFVKYLYLHICQIFVYILYMHPAAQCYFWQTLKCGYLPQNLFNRKNFI